MMEINKCHISFGTTRSAWSFNRQNSWGRNSWGRKGTLNPLRIYRSMPKIISLKIIPVFVLTFKGSFKTRKGQIHARLPFTKHVVTNMGSHQTVHFLLLLHIWCLGTGLGSVKRESRIQQHWTTFTVVTSCSSKAPWASIHSNSSVELWKISHLQNSQRDEGVTFKMFQFLIYLKSAQSQGP